MIKKRRKKEKLKFRPAAQAAAFKPSILRWCVHAIFVGAGFYLLHVGPGDLNSDLWACNECFYHLSHPAGTHVLTLMGADSSEKLGSNSYLLRR